MAVLRRTEDLFIFNLLDGNDEDVDVFEERRLSGLIGAGIIAVISISIGWYISLKG